MKILDKNNIENFLEDIEYENIESVKNILNDVKKNGDSAVKKYSYEFDKMEFGESDSFEISEENIKKALNSIDEKTLIAIKKAIKNIQKFALKQLKSIKELKIKEKGSVMGHKITPIESVLCYAPGGGYPLPSSAIMTVAVAKVAGVKNIYLTSPKIHPATIVAGYLAGANRIFKIGGVQAIAGFAYGTESLPKVDKIVGPGNKFVTAAKKEVYGLCDIDFLAGPSEVLVVADETANPELISADLLAQCEHDKDARGYLITTSKELAQNVKKSAYKQLESLGTKEIAQISFEKSIAIIVDNIEEAIELSNLRAPEHLEVMIKDEKKYIDKFTNYGSLFIGNNCAEVFGDYCTGTNHVLPTNKVARYRGGLSVFDFIKIQTYQKISKKYGEELSKIASELAKTEGLMAHKLASDLRGKKNEN